MTRKKPTKKAKSGSTVSKKKSKISKASSGTGPTTRKTRKPRRLSSTSKTSRGGFGAKIKATAKELSRTTREPRKRTQAETKAETEAEISARAEEQAHAEAEAAIAARLEDTRFALEGEGIGARTSYHSYKDRTIDGEIVIDIRRGDDAVEVMRKLEEAFSVENRRGLWFQVGARFAVREGEEELASGIVDRRKGMDEVGMHYRRMYSQDKHERTAQIIEPFLAMERQAIPAMERKYGRKAQSVFVRLHWNPDYKKPKR